MSISIAGVQNGFNLSISACAGEVKILISQWTHVSSRQSASGTLLWRAAGWDGLGAGGAVGVTLRIPKIHLVQLPSSDIVQLEHVH